MELVASYDYGRVEVYACERDEEGRVARLVVKGEPDRYFNHLSIAMAYGRRA